jgi:hypothetical protein
MEPKGYARSQQLYCTNLGDSHVDAAVVLANVEIEIFIVDAHVTPIGQVALEAAIIGAELLEQIRERVAELDHTLGRYRDLRPWAATRYRLGDL